MPPPAKQERGRKGAPKEEERGKFSLYCKAFFDRMKKIDKIKLYQKIGFVKEGRTVKRRQISPKKRSPTSQKIGVLASFNKGQLEHQREQANYPI